MLAANGGGSRLARPRPTEITVCRLWTRRTIIGERPVLSCLDGGLQWKRLHNLSGFYCCSRAVVVIIWLTLMRLYWRMFEGVRRGMVVRGWVESGWYWEYWISVSLKRWIDCSVGLFCLANLFLELFGEFFRELMLFVAVLSNFFDEGSLAFIYFLKWINVEFFCKYLMNL